MNLYISLSICILSLANAITVDKTGCACIKSNYDCGCCADLNISAIGLDNNVCVNATYLPKDYGISLTFSIDGKVYLNETISARNPPPICIDVPHLKQYASICIDFYNLDISGKHFSGCIDLEARLIHVIQEKVHLGCFHLGQVRELENWVSIPQQHLYKGIQQLKEMETQRIKKIASLN